MYDDLRGRLKELAKIELHDDGMGVYRISAEGLEVIKELATAAEAAIEDLSEQISEQEVTPETEHFIDKWHGKKRRPRHERTDKGHGETRSLSEMPYEGD